MVAMILAKGCLTLLVQSAPSGSASLCGAVRAESSRISTPLLSRQSGKSAHSVYRHSCTHKTGRKFESKSEQRFAFPMSHLNHPSMKGRAQAATNLPRSNSNSIKQERIQENVRNHQILDLATHQIIAGMH